MFHVNVFFHIDILIRVRRRWGKGQPGALPAGDFAHEGADLVKVSLLIWMLGLRAVHDAHGVRTRLVFLQVSI